MFTGKNSVADASQIKLVVTAKTRVSTDVVALTLAHPDGRRLPDWTPGSHVDVVLPSGINRQYSLCGDRWDAYSYRIAVLHERAGRGGSAYIHEELTQGTMVAVGGPRNNFPLVPSEKYLFIAGGIGITPMLPMIQQADMLGADWKLIYLGRSRSTMAFLDELAAYGERVVVMPKDETGPCQLDELIGGPSIGHENLRVRSAAPVDGRRASLRRLADRVAASGTFRGQDPGCPGTRHGLRGKAGPGRTLRHCFPGCEHS